MLIQIHVSDQAGARLAKIARSEGRPIANLAAAAVEEAALDYFRGRKDDPAGRPQQPIYESEVS